jgi:hypothetical protein
MTTIVKVGAKKLTLRQQKGRAVNAVAEVLRRKLLVPNIYLEPPYMAVDVLGVDRAGSGDLHAVEIRLHDNTMENPAPVRISAERRRGLHRRVALRSLARGRLMSLPAHYKYFAVPESWRASLVGEPGPHLYSPDGIGRIGIIVLTDRGEDAPIAEIVIAPERFRVDAAKLSRIEKNLINNKKVRPDIEVRI